MFLTRSAINLKSKTFKLKATECDTCELKETSELRFSQIDQGVFVYLFEVTFKPGKNQFFHSYSFPASTNVEMAQFYNYILTTGNKWAGEKIKDLTIEIDIGINKYFYVKDIFQDKANWTIIGTGKVTNKKFDYYDKDSCRMIRLLSGKLQIAVKEFKPINNIEFGIIDDHSFITPPTDFQRIQNKTAFGIGHLNLDESHTKRELKFLRNTIYAQYGYQFKDPELQSYFNQFEWYLPDPNLKLEMIALTAREKQFIDEIMKREKE